jgi:hypothetical protein
MCFNAVDLNSITKISKRHVPDTFSVIDELYDARVMSLVDLKGAFLNHPVEEGSKKYLGFKT